MSAKTIGAAQFKEKCLAILDEVGPEGIIVTKHGKPVAKLIPIETDSAHLIGSLKDEIDVKGTIINYKHHLGRSGVPHGRTSAILKDALWNQLWAARGEYAQADILLRSHVHYHNYAGNSNTLAMTLPALQGYGTKFGGRRMSGTVDVGFVVFDIYGPNDYTWQPYIWRAALKPAMVAA